MAASILSHVVSDLCIGKPAVRVLPPSTPIAAALATLRAGADPFVFVDAAPPDAKKTAVLSVVKVSVAEILVLRLRRRLLDAIDALLANNSHSLVVPLHARARKKHHHVSAGYCVLTQQDIVRHLFGSISLFSPVAALSVSSLGLVRRDDVHAVHVDDDALDAIPLLRRSIGQGTAVAVVADDDALVGEICPGVLGSCDDVESVSAAFATLSAGDAMTYIDCYFSPPEFLLRSIRAELTGKGLHAMCDLMDAAYTTDVGALSSSSTSSDEECLPLAPARRARKMSSGSFRWRSTEDVAACHAESSLVAVMAQALAHRVGHVWVVDELSGALVGVVSCADVLAVLRDHLRPE
uniref:Uncharacterized protein n=1 Tax=Aegilops tauschii TaxID=37682 RepID=M8AR88_AEGTA